MAFWAWVVGLSVVALMIYELILWIKRKRNPQLEEPGAAEEAAEQAQAELTRANMKIAVLESRLEESQVVREEERAELLEQQQKQLAQTEAAYQRQMVTLSERMAENGKGDWRVAVEKEKAEKNAELYPVRMAAEVAAWKATVLGEEAVADTAVSKDLALTTKDDNENIDEHDPAVNIPSAETADPNSEIYPHMQETIGEEDDIAAAVAEISGLDPAEIGASYEEEYGPDVDIPGESWVLVEQNGTQSSGSNGYAAVEADEDDFEEPVEVDLWQDDGEHDVMDQITVLDEADADDLEETAVVEDYLLVVDNDADAHASEAMVNLLEEEPVEVEETELAAEIEPQPAQDLALLAGLGDAGDEVEDTIEALEHADDQAVEVEIETAQEDEVVTALDAEVVTTVDDEVVTTLDDEVVTALDDEVVTALHDEVVITVDDEVVTAVDDEVVFEVSEIGDETAVDVEENSTFENRWPDLEDQAKQRVLARRLSSEMDADYLDDEEYLREMGIQQSMPEQVLLPGEATEDIMGAENWVTDPLEEMANHINGEAQIVPEPAPNEMESSEEAVAPAVEVADNMWEEMVYASAEAVRESNGSEGSAAAEAEAPDFDDVDDEDAVIAATVAAILSRAPDGHEPEESDPDQTAAVQRSFGSDQNGSDRNGSAIFDGLATEAYADEDPLAGVPADDAAFEGLAADVGTDVEVENQDAGEHSDEANGNWERPSLDWQRQPVVWQAEYYANTGLADEPAVVRQDREIDFEWRDRAPAQGVEPRTFSVRWSSVLRLVEGQYRFTASAPDGMRLWLNDRLVISAWYDQSEQTYQRDFFWHGGPIDVRVEHYENGGNAKAFLTWDRVE